MEADGRLSKIIFLILSEVDDNPAGISPEVEFAVQSFGIGFTTLTFLLIDEGPPFIVTAQSHKEIEWW
jgi:hypothetical protein